MRDKTTLKVLLVDPDEQIHEKIKTFFERLQNRLKMHLTFEVTCVVCGGDACEEFSTIQFDIVIMEILLPKQNGWMVAKYIRDFETIFENFHKACFIISLTNIGSEINAITAELYDINLALDKPLDGKQKELLKKRLLDYFQKSS